MHLEEKAAQIVDLFARLGVLEHPQHPTRYGPVIRMGSIVQERGCIRQKALG